ncbi:hypothetical protein BDW67DRAFT_136626 [Aspergillus spinulosporus]
MLGAEVCEPTIHFFNYAVKLNNPYNGVAPWLYGIHLCIFLIGSRTRKSVTLPRKGEGRGNCCSLRIGIGCITFHHTAQQIYSNTSPSNEQQPERQVAYQIVSGPTVFKRKMIRRQADAFIIRHTAKPRNA